MMAAGRWRQLRLLVWKNWLFSIRSWKSTVLQLFAPCFFLLLVTAVSYLPPALEDVPYPPVESIRSLPKCYGWNSHGCRSLVALNLNYKEIPNPEPSGPPIGDCMTELLHEFSYRSGLSITDSLNEHADILVISNIFESGAFFLSNDSFDNHTQVAVGFFECNITADPPKLNYTILFNSSRALKFQQLIFGSPNKPDGRVELASMLDTIFLSKVLNKNIHVNVSASTFPVFNQRESVQSRQATSSTEFVFCAITFQFVMMMYNVVSEKDLKLRQGLKLIGLKDSVYWFAWSITGVIISFISTCVLMITGYACQLQFFLNTNFWINFFLFLLYSCSMVPLAFFASVFISTVRQAVNTGMVVFVVGLLVISLLANPFLLTELYEYVRPLVLVLGFLPPFHLAKIMADIGIAASDTDINGLPQTTHHFSWHDLFIKRPVLTFDFSTDPGQTPTSSVFYMPPTYFSFVGLIFNAIFYSVLAWYLDAVFPGNHGIPRKWYFPFQPSYWFDWLPYFAHQTKQLHVRVQSPKIQANNVEEEDDVIGSENDVTEGTALLHSNQGYGSNSYALRIEGLKKSFKSGNCCCKRLNKPAVDGLSLCTTEHQILALLGHNGAGKTTTINMLIGLLSPDEGDAFFYNLSVRENLDAIRSVLGVCPQHDILWGDLTAKEHMQLFGTLKDIQRDQLEAEIERLLEDVNLSQVANHRVKTFSGGMKRRLSVALSFLGDPRVIFLDEPTTGMDPKIRRDVWNLILRMKKDRVMIMTTHSMEEADILGDSIAIMANGQLKVMGTSVNLKNRYAGYNIELVVRHEDLQRLLDFVRKQLPGATPKSDPIEVEGGLLVPYNLSPDRNTEIVPFFKVIEGDQSIKEMILDYSISQTTLEEVFLNVTVNELFQDVTYQPVLVRAHSFSPLPPTEPGRLSPLTMPLSDNDSSTKVLPRGVLT